ncbi:MAG: hypothetical protein HP496_16135 [Nitrospira sp.]|nr:hypothetical protein [Nitrospira sp.]
MKDRGWDVPRIFPPPSTCDPGKESKLLDYASIFLCFGLIAGGLHWAGVAVVATQGSWTLLASGIVLLMIHMIAGRTVRVP